MRRRKNRPRPCAVTPAYERAAQAAKASVDPDLDLPHGTRAQVVRCERCHQWHLAAVPLTAAGLAADAATLDRMCRRKVRYATEGAALVVAIQRDVGLRPYRCPLCAGWHLTKKRKGVDDTIS